MANRKKRSKKRDQVLLDRLRAGDTIEAAARQAGYSVTQLREYRHQDAQLEQDMQDAIVEGTALLEDEVMRRARDGVEEPVFYLGQEVGTVRKYSDTLAMFLLKARKPETYVDKTQVEHSGPKGGPIETKSTAASEVEKLIGDIARRKSTAAGDS